MKSQKDIKLIYLITLHLKYFIDVTVNIMCLVFILFNYFEELLLFNSYNTGGGERVSKRWWGADRHADMLVCKYVLQK